MELQGDGYAKSASRSRQENLLSSICLEVASILINASSRPPLSLTSQWEHSRIYDGHDY